MPLQKVSNSSRVDRFCSQSFFGRRAVGNSLSFHRTPLIVSVAAPKVENGLDSVVLQPHNAFVVGLAPAQKTLVDAVKIRDVLGKRPEAGDLALRREFSHLFGPADIESCIAGVFEGFF